MTTLNYGSAIMEFIGGYGALNSSDPIIKYCSFAFCVIWGIFYGVIYCIWMVKDPDRLQTESYNLQSQAMVLGKTSFSSGKYVEMDNAILTESLGSASGQTAIAEIKSLK